MLLKKKLPVVFLCMLCVLLTACSMPKSAEEKPAAYTVTDIEGTVVDFPSPPKRIVTLSMSTDETMLGLVEPQRMAAVNTLLDDPVSSNVTGLVKEIPQRIGNPTVEEIMALQPDLVVVPDWGDLTMVPSLREVGLKVIVCKGASNLAEIRETIELLAAAAGVPERGQKLRAMMDAKLAEIQEKVAKIPQTERKRVVLISLMSGYGGLGSSFDEACHYAGVINGRAELGIRDFQVMTKEQLVQIDPDILFLPTYNDHGKYDVEKFRREYLDDPSLQTMKAIRNEAFAEPFEGYIYNCSQDFVFGVQEIAYRVYGDEFKQGEDEHLSAVK
ncbi:heme ABC superfamily ATP binding cassette transporter, binding protein [Centipeda periodontii DSM 2778]|uniref:Heme ABC superfamily ATP binding cassette transporter, binding protein n=2 Tax=Centipeda TaxID=82202 RepID=F5RNZ3_9FIRM|nr:heme ABC superfamily ATP binding cassette transporter, binding protein [Centipeda periodontii DSM 2778]